jgi:hypothetical protein
MAVDFFSLNPGLSLYMADTQLYNYIMLNIEYPGHSQACMRDV